MKNVKIETIQEFEARGGKVTKLKPANRSRKSPAAKGGREVALKRIARWTVFERAA